MPSMSGISSADVRKVNDIQQIHMPLAATAEAITHVLGAPVTPDVVVFLLKRVGTSERDSAYICAAARRMSIDMSRGKPRDMVFSEERSFLHTRLGV